MSTDLSRKINNNSLLSLYLFYHLHHYHLPSDTQIMRPHEGGNVTYTEHNTSSCLEQVFAPQDRACPIFWSLVINPSSYLQTFSHITVYTERRSTFVSTSVCGVGLVGVYLGWICLSSKLQIIKKI